MYKMGEYFRSGCHIDTGRGLLESTSSWFIHDHPSHQETFKTGHRIHTRFTITRHPRTGHPDTVICQNPGTEELQDRRRHILFMYIIVVSTHANIG